MPNAADPTDPRPRWRIASVAILRGWLALTVLALCGSIVIWAAIHLHGVLSMILAGSEQIPAILLPPLAIWIYDRFGLDWLSNRAAQARELAQSFSAPRLRPYFRRMGGLIVHAPVTMALILPVPYVIQHVRAELASEPAFPFEGLVESIGDRTRQDMRRIGEELIAAQIQDPPGLMSGEIVRALTAQGFTTERAALLDRLAIESPRAEHYIARFPVLFEAADLGPPGALPEIPDVAEVEFGPGVQYDANRNANVIGALVTALAPCAGNGPDRVELRVEGYASSQPFRNEEGAVLHNSDELNVHLANERRRVVEGLLRLAIADEGVQNRMVLAEVPNYAGLDEMIGDREFNDRPGGLEVVAEAPPQDMFTRAAHIKVLHAGLCAVD